RSEIYVEPLPSGPKQLVSNSGGETPIWRRDGREIFYRAADGRLNAVTVTPRGSRLEFGAPQALFDLRLAGTSSYFPRQFDVAPDGSRFLVIRRADMESADSIVVDVNWTSRLRR